MPVLVAQGALCRSTGTSGREASAFDKRAPASIAFVREAICIASLSTPNLIHGGTRWTNLIEDQLWRSD